MMKFTKPMTTHPRTPGLSGPRLRFVQNGKQHILKISIDAATMKSAGLLVGDRVLFGYDAEMRTFGIKRSMKDGFILSGQPGAKGQPEKSSIQIRSQNATGLGITMFPAGEYADCRNVWVEDGVLHIENPLHRTGLSVAAE